MEQLLGAHTSIAGGVSNAVELAAKLKFTAMQIFSKNNNRWNANPLKEDEIKSFKSKLSLSDIKFIVAHDSYLINLCSPSKELLKKSRISFIEEPKRCELLGIPYLNFHPGAHKGNGEEAGLRLIAESLNYIHGNTKNLKVNCMLELTAGQGTSLGYRFEHIRKIINMIKDKNRMSVCIDTAHIFAAGYDIKDANNYKLVMKEFDDIVGFGWLKCFHMNDSKKGLGSRVDRHEHIGKGYIGKAGFSNIMNDQRFTKIPKILETPKGKGQLEDLKNLAILRSLIKK
jgi:deoxyribonuclease-4